MPHNLENIGTGMQPVTPGQWDGQGNSAWENGGWIDWPGGDTRRDRAYAGDTRFGEWWDRHGSEYTAYTKRAGRELEAAWADWTALQETYGGHMSNITEQMEKLDPLTHTGYYAPQQEFKIELARADAEQLMQTGQRSLAYKKGSKTLEGSGYLDQLNKDLMKGYETTMAAESFDALAWARGEAGGAEDIMAGFTEQLVDYQTYLI